MIVQESTNSQTPTCALLVQSKGLYHTNTALDNIHKIEILDKYYYKDHRFSTYETKSSSLLLCEWKSSGNTILGFEGRRGYTVKFQNLHAYMFNIPEPREAKCCQPWFDAVTDVNDPHESIGITKICTVRNVHAILNSLKIITCLKCDMQTPGFDIPFSELQVLQNGRKQYLENDDIINALTKSEVLKCSVKLCPTFATSPECKSTSKSASGICTDCSQYYVLGDSGEINKKSDYSAFVRNCTTTMDNEEQPMNTCNVEDNFNINDINPYSSENLISTCLWNDEAYRLFANTLTEAEKMVLTPLHVQVIILRLTSNHVPFSRHGAICYPLQKFNQAINLPWFNFRQLPFIVFTHKDKLGSVHEALVDMNKIRKAREFMTRDKIDPVNGKPRKYYRFSDEIPFHNDNMNMLAESLTDPTKPSYPKELRTLKQSELHQRADKPIQLLELQNWLQSRYEYADSIWDSYKAKCIKDNKPPLAEDFFHDIKHFLLACHPENENHSESTTTNTNNLDINSVNVTVCNIVQYGIQQKWLQGNTSLSQTTTDVSTGNNKIFDSTNLPESLKELLFNFCEELELLSRDYSNDEGQESSVATGVRAEIETEHPDILIQQGLQQSVLHRVPMPQPRWENPIPEHFPGFLQKAYPFFFLVVMEIQCNQTLGISKNQRVHGNKHG